MQHRLDPNVLGSSSELYHLQQHQVTIHTGEASLHDRVVISDGRNRTVPSTRGIRSRCDGESYHKRETCDFFAIYKKIAPLFCL